jgi:hypothetical protein
VRNGALFLPEKIEFTGQNGSARPLIGGTETIEAVSHRYGLKFRSTLPAPQLNDLSSFLISPDIYTPDDFYFNLLK